MSYKTKKFLVFLLIIAGLVIIDLALIPAKFVTHEEINKHYVSILISGISRYKKTNGKLPSTLNDIEFNSEEITKILRQRNIQYFPKGKKDKSNKLWLIILADKNAPDYLYVGNLTEETVIKKTISLIWHRIHGYITSIWPSIVKNKLPLWVGKIVLIHRFS